MEVRRGERGLEIDTQFKYGPAADAAPLHAELIPISPHRFLEVLSADDPGTPITFVMSTTDAADTGDMHLRATHLHAGLRSTPRRDP